MNNITEFKEIKPMEYGGTPCKSDMVDGEKTLITSANLSYHGQQGNIELGTVIDSKDIAKQVEDIFT